MPLTVDEIGKRIAHAPAEVLNRAFDNLPKPKTQTLNDEEIREILLNYHRVLASVDQKPHDPKTRQALLASIENKGLVDNPDLTFSDAKGISYKYPYHPPKRYVFGDESHGVADRYFQGLKIKFNVVYDNTPFEIRYFAKLNKDQQVMNASAQLYYQGRAIGEEFNSAKIEQLVNSKLASLNLPLQPTLSFSDFNNFFPDFEHMRSPWQKPLLDPPGTNVQN